MQLYSNRRVHPDMWHVHLASIRPVGAQLTVPCLSLLLHHREVLHQVF